MKHRFLSYHRFLFQWHCRTFFDFSKAFTDTERDYLEVCFRLPKSKLEVSEGGYRHFSFHTYSHRVKGDKVNSSRIAYGSVENWERAWEPARPVLAERGITLPDKVDEHRFYGLGWDFEKAQFKVYFRTLDWRGLPPCVAHLVSSYKFEEHRAEALLSLTYEGTEVVEHKVYLYPLADESSRLAKMITDRRGEVVQADLEPEERDVYDLNETGRQIVARYDEIDMNLDTIAYQSEDDFTLYFP